MTSEYIIVETFCNDEKIADKIISTLLKKKLVAGSQKSVVESKYWWNNKLETEKEFKLEFRTRKDKHDNIVEEIKKIHNYEVAEITSIDINRANLEFYYWIDDSIR